MKENVLDVLMYLFENYMDEEVEVDSDQETLMAELLEAGFPRSEISKAFAWMDGLAALRQHHPAETFSNSQSIRIYTEREQGKLGTELRGFLQFLEEVGVLDQRNRELVIDRVMALETEEIDLDQVKWVVLMVLFNQPGQEAAVAWMEDLVYEEMTGTMH